MPRFSLITVNRSQTGFSLLELLIVVTVIAILTAIAVPSIVKSRQYAYEAAAAYFLHNLFSNQEAYRSTGEVYSALFSEMGYSDAVPGSCKVGGGASCDVLVFNGYAFTLASDAAATWHCVAEPVMMRGVSRFFFMNQTGIVYALRGDYADATSPALQ